MAYDYSSDSKLLELPNPYRLQNQLLWLCALLLVSAGLMCLVLARGALQEQTLRLVAAPLAAGLVMLVAGLAGAAAAALRLRFYFGRGRPASLAPEIAMGANGGSPAADEIKRDLRQGGLTYPEPKGPIANLLYHWVPTLITAPLVVQALAQRTAFNLAATAMVLLSFVFSGLAFGSELTRPWIGIIYFVFGLFFLVRPVLAEQRARIGTPGLVALIAAAILAPVVLGLLGPNLPSLGGFSLTVQTFVMLGTALLACTLAMIAVLAQVDPLPQTRASVEQQRLSMNAPPATLMDELDRTLQSQWSERIPNRRYTRIDPVVAASTPAGTFAGELFDETQPLPLPGARAPSFGAALGERRHRPLLLLDLYATVLVIVAIGMTLAFVRGFDVAAPWQDARYALLGTAGILGFVALFSFRSASGLWGRFDFESVLTWVEMAGSYQTSRIGTGNNFSSRMNTENDVVRTESMTLRVWRARIESVVFGKDQARQITAMFSTEAEARELSAHLMDFARGQSVLVAPGSSEDQARIAALNAGERAIAPASDAAVVAQIGRDMGSARGLIAPGGVPAAAAARFCPACGTPVTPGARFCSQCAAPVGV